MQQIGADALLRQSQRYLMNTYGSRELMLVKGQGVRVWDHTGKEYLDFLAGIGVNNLGHCHPCIVEAIRTQAEQLLHCSNLYLIAPQIELAALLCEHSFAERVFLANSGAEANEGAIKLVRLYSKQKFSDERTTIITMHRSFHGRTMATLSATGQEKVQKGFEPLVPGFVFATFNDLASVERLISRTTCAILVEPIQGEAGVIPATPDFLAGLRRLCNAHALALIFDEIQCGLGRTGTNFAYEHYGVVPDVMTLAKALGGGVPIGALLAKGELAEAFQPGHHASTFGGNPLAASAALAYLRELFDGQLATSAARMGKFLRGEFEALAARHACIRQVRGVGLMLALELGPPLAKQVVAACRQQGLLINAIGEHVLRLLPPLIITEADCREACMKLDSALREVAP